VKSPEFSTARPPSPRQYLFSLELFGIKLGLEQIRGLVAALDHPDRAFPSLIVAGTNGKGSTAAMIERALRAAGYRTGRYTSPHLVDIEERFCVDGLQISAATFDRIAARVREAAATLPAPPSFFEATTALALDVFREARVDVAVLEVGPAAASTPPTSSRRSPARSPRLTSTTSSISATLSPRLPPRRPG